MVPAASGSAVDAVAAAISEVPQVQAGGASTVSFWSSQQGMVQVPAAQQSLMASISSLPSVSSTAKALTDRERAIQSARNSAKSFLMFFIFSLLTPPPRW